MIAAAVIVTAVVLITSHQPRVKALKEAAEEASPAPRLSERNCFEAAD